MNRLYVIFLFVLLASQYKSSAQGKQISETGIRHSFLVSGKFTALIGEDNAVIWKAPGYARDGMVLDNGNILLSINMRPENIKKIAPKLFGHIRWILVTRSWEPSIDYLTATL